MADRAFTAAQLLSVSTARLLCDFDELVDLLEHVTGARVRARQLARAGRLTQQEVIRQHPWTTRIEPPDDWRDPVVRARWLRARAEEHGAWHVVVPLPAGTYEPRSTVGEMTELMGARLGRHDRRAR